MSVEAIRKIIRHHTGENASDSRKIGHDEVRAMLQAARDTGQITPEERLELLAALTMFGGSDLHPNIFASWADRQTLEAAVLEGLESADSFGGLPYRDQALLVEGLLLSGGPLGFERVVKKLEDLPPALRTRLSAQVKANRAKAGDDFGESANVLVLALMRRDEVYGFKLECSYPAHDRSLFLCTDDVLSPQGALLQFRGDFEPLDSPES